MNNYICTFCYQGEVTILETEAENRDNAFLKTISVKEKQDYRDWRVEQMTANGYFKRAFYGGL